MNSILGLMTCSCGPWKVSWEKMGRGNCLGSSLTSSPLKRQFSKPSHIPPSPMSWAPIVLPHQNIFASADTILTPTFLKMSFSSPYFCSFITFFKIQLCLKHYGGQCKHTEFTCYAGVETCIQIFRIKGLWGQMFQQWPRYDVWCLGESR